MSDVILKITDKGKQHTHALGNGGIVLRYLDTHGPTAKHEMRQKFGPQGLRIAKQLHRKGLVATETDE